ncbi:MAG: T9SS type A sorting domain-containing protein [Crocinitomicaceae bacterium]|nr:T9SS type A sorting domain-containing protein [Crocinitomicaceae bacterium]
MKFLITTAFITTGIHQLFAQCNPAPGNVYAFTANGIDYEIIKENLSWNDAATCAVNRGGMLTEINSQLENDSIFYHVNLAGITASNTDAPDGGGAAYLWIGGNDIATEGAWVWDGNNDATATQFWQGTSTGTPVGGLYNNWGNEPDDFSGQDGLGFAFTDWPFGVAGEWNDIDTANQLYFIIEFPHDLGTENEINTGGINIYPNPSNGLVYFHNTGEKATFNLVSADGKLFYELTISNQQTVSLLLDSGLYFLINTSSGTNQKILVE